MQIFVPFKVASQWQPFGKFQTSLMNANHCCAKQNRSNNRFLPIEPDTAVLLRPVSLITHTNLVAFGSDNWRTQSDITHRGAWKLKLSEWVNGEGGEGEAWRGSLRTRQILQQFIMQIRLIDLINSLTLTCSQNSPRKPAGNTLTNTQNLLQWNNKRWHYPFQWPLASDLYNPWPNFVFVLS